MEEEDDPITIGFDNEEDQINKVQKLIPTAIVEIVNNRPRKNSMTRIECDVIFRRASLLAQRRG